MAKTIKEYQFTPEEISDELTDRIGQGWSNDRIAAAYADTGPNLRRWLNSRRAKLRREFGSEMYS